MQPSWARVLAELRGLRVNKNEMRALRDEVAALRSELAETRALPTPAIPERIDRVLEVQMQAEADDGLIVKAARWLERVLRR